MREAADSGSDHRLRIDSGAASQDTKTSRHAPVPEAPASRFPCLTDLSPSRLLTGAVCISMILWFAIILVI